MEEQDSGNQACPCADLGDCADEEKDIYYCYVEGTPDDKNDKETNKEIQEEVWCKMKPPKRSWPLCKPFVSARQIEITRTLLMGKNIPQSDEDGEFVREIEVVPMSINKKKSSVRFFSKGIY